jgi:SSS family solute:Na+ symporter
VTPLDWTALSAYFALLLGRQGIQAYLAPPIAAVFFLGVFFRRLNAPGCLAALVAGFALGFFRLAVDTPVTLGAVIVSLATAPPPAAQLAGLTYATVTREQRAESRRSWDSREVATSGLVLLLVAITYIFFTG